MKEIEYDSEAVNHISRAAEEMVTLAKDNDCAVVSKFNDIPVRATPSSTPDQVVAAFSAECERQRQAWIISPEYKKQQEELRLKDEQKQKAFTAAIAASPAEISLSDAEFLKKQVEVNSDPYSACTVQYAIDWGRIMEGMMAKGMTIEQCADEASQIADGPHGITGFMYGCAVSILSKCWKHGEELRRWHNLKTQIRDEGEKANASGGILNPAMLSIG